MAGSRPQRRRGVRRADHFLRTYGPGMKQLAMGIAPAIARSNPALAAGIASVASAADGYSQLRTSLGD